MCMLLGRDAGLLGHPRWLRARLFDRQVIQLLVVIRDGERQVRLLRLRNGMRRLWLQLLEDRRHVRNVVDVWIIKRAGCPPATQGLLSIFSGESPRVLDAADTG